MNLNASINLLDISNVSDCYDEVARSSNLPFSSIKLKPTKINKALKMLISTMGDDELDYYFRSLVFNITTRPNTGTRSSIKKWQLELVAMMCISAMDKPDIIFARLVGPTLAFRIAAFVKPILRHAAPLPDSSFAQWYLSRLSVFSGGIVVLTPVGKDTAFSAGWDRGMPVAERDDGFRSSFLTKLFDQSMFDFKISSSQSDSLLNQTATSDYLEVVKHEVALSSTPCKLRKTRTPLKPRKSVGQSRLTVAGPDLECFTKRLNIELENSLIEVPILQFPSMQIVVDVQPPTPSKADFSTSMNVQTSTDEFFVRGSRTIGTQTTFSIPTIIMRSVAVQCSFPEAECVEQFVIYEDSISVGSFVLDDADFASKAELAGLPGSVDDVFELDSSFE